MLPRLATAVKRLFLHGAPSKKWLPQPLNGGGIITSKEGKSAAKMARSPAGYVSVMITRAA